MAQQIAKLTNEVSSAVLINGDMVHVTQTHSCLAQAIANRLRREAGPMLYTAKANQLYQLTDDEVKRMKAKILFVPARSDLIFPPEMSQRAAERYRAQGGVAEVAVIDGDGGHLEGVFNVAKQGDAIRAFIAR